MLQGTTYDISEYVNTNKSQVNVALPYKEIDFGYDGNRNFPCFTIRTINRKKMGCRINL